MPVTLSVSLTSDSYIFYTPLPYSLCTPIHRPCSCYVEISNSPNVFLVGWGLVMDVGLSIEAFGFRCLVRRSLVVKIQEVVAGRITASRVEIGGLEHRALNPKPSSLNHPPKL